MTAQDNPLLQPWQTRYQLPPFEQIRSEHFAPAFAVLFDRHLKEIDAIATNAEAPTFDNTVAAFDASVIVGISADMILRMLSPTFFASAFADTNF